MTPPSIDVTCCRPAGHVAGFAPTCRATAQNDRIGSHGQQDQKTEHGVADKLTHACPAQQALLEHLDQQDPEQGADHRAGSAEDVDPTDHHRYHLQLESLRCSGCDRTKARQIHESGHAGKRPTNREGRKDIAFDGESGSVCGIGLEPMAKSRRPNGR